MRLRLLVPLLALLVAMPLPAHAESFSAGDSRRDVTTYDYSPEPAPCGTYTEKVDSRDRITDITRVTVRHTASAVLVMVRLRDVDATAELQETVFLRGPEKNYEVDVVQGKARRPPFTSLMRMPDYEALLEGAGECGSLIISSSGLACRDLQGDVDPARDRITVVVPRGCIGDPRWVRVGVSTSTWHGDVAEPGGSYDRWQPPGSQPSSRIDGPYGPRVRVG